MSRAWKALITRVKEALRGDERERGAQVEEPRGVGRSVDNQKEPKGVKCNLTAKGGEAVCQGNEERACQSLSCEMNPT